MHPSSTACCCLPCLLNAVLNANETAEAEAMVQDVIEQGMLSAEQGAAAFGDGTYTGAFGRANSDEGPLHAAAFLATGA